MKDQRLSLLAEERDSNPRPKSCPYTNFPGLLLQPLGHLSSYLYNVHLWTHHTVAPCSFLRRSPTDQTCSFNHSRRIPLDGHLSKREGKITLFYPFKPPGVFCGDLRYFGCGNALVLRQYVCRLLILLTAVALSTVRDRREIRCIGFQNEVLQINFFNNCGQTAVFKRNPHPPIPR